MSKLRRSPAARAAYSGFSGRDTTKGTIAHMRSPAESVKRSGELGLSRFIVFPKFVTGSETVLEDRAKSRAFMEIAGQSFNFNVLGDLGFAMIKRLIGDCDCFDLTYSNLDEVVGLLDSLVSNHS